jgi:hypothetical protein
LHSHNPPKKRSAPAKQKTGKKQNTTEVERMKIELESIENIVLWDVFSVVEKLDAAYHRKSTRCPHEEVLREMSANYITK